MAKVKIGVVGYTGRMGKQVISAILNSNLVTLSKCVSGGSNTSPMDRIAPSNIASSIEEVFSASDVVIEFTNTDTMKQCLTCAQASGKPMVSGTTGHNNYELMKEVSKNTAVLWSANMSPGITWLLKLVEKTAKALNEEYDIEISELHHSQKKDSPSGTGLMLGKAAAYGRSIDFTANQAIDRIGARKTGEIGFSVSRGGGVSGEHNVMFIGDDEYISLKHVALTRNVFAKGAIKGALWLHEKKKGLYSMQDVLNAAQ